LALLGISAVVAGLALLPAGQGSASTLSGHASPTPTATPSKTGSPQPTGKAKPRHKHAGTTVIGKRLYDPATQKRFKVHSSVTVSQTTHLTNQFVVVKWKHFTPSIPQTGEPDVYGQTGLTYPVMVAECNTLHVKYWSQCYGAANTQGAVGSIGPDGPDNTAYATTLPNGTGEVEIQVLVAEQNQFLGCGIHHRCSLVIVPAQGGSSSGCSDHSEDVFFTGFGVSDFGGGTYAACSWRDRIVVPLSFVQAPKFCPIRNSSFTALGSPMLNLAMQQWLGALCVQANPLTITYNPAITEPSAVQDIGLGLGDVALTTRPGPTQIGKRKFVFAPVAVSAVAVAYWLDSPKTFLPYTSLKLDPRLIAKLVTQSYAFVGDACKGPSGAGVTCDNAVDGNPGSLFDDPEFKKLNPRILPPVFSQTGIQVPTVMSGHSDMTWQVTRWIADNPQSSAFMRGQFDPWGMHVNTNYLTVHYPIDGFTGQDNFPIIAHKYSPAFPLSALVQLQAENLDNGTQWQIDKASGNYPKDSPEITGERALFAIIDEGDAAVQDFPVAKLLNGSGHYVAPTLKSMAAAVATMQPIGGHGIVKQVNFAKQKRDAYPLTMVIYAMVPTSGISKSKAAAIASFLDYAAGPGQQRGLNVGQLPPGYLPLPAKLRAQTLHAAELVATQAGNPKPPKKKKHHTSGSGSNGPGGSKSPGGGKSSSPTPTPTPSPTPRIVTVALKSASSVGIVRYALPVLLILGGLTALGGASSLLASTLGTAILAPLRRIRRPHLALRRKN
jgi:hypothetical protein